MITTVFEEAFYKDVSRISGVVETDRAARRPNARDVLLRSVLSMAVVGSSLVAAQEVEASASFAVGGDYVVTTQSDVLAPQEARRAPATNAALHEFASMAASLADAPDDDRSPEFLALASAIAAEEPEPSRLDEAWSQRLAEDLVDADDD